MHIPTTNQSYACDLHNHAKISRHNIHRLNVRWLDAIHITLILSTIKDKKNLESTNHNRRFGRTKLYSLRHLYICTTSVNVACQF